MLQEACRVVLALADEHLYTFELQEVNCSDNRCVA